MSMGEQKKSIKMPLYFSKKDFEIDFPEHLENEIVTIIDELNTTLRRHMDELCLHTVKNAEDFTEATGEAFYLWLSEDDEDRYIDELMTPWNDGDIGELVSILERWYDEDAVKVAEACKDSLNGKQVSLTELHRLVAEIILQLNMFKYNFGCVYPALKEKLENDPKEILPFIDPLQVCIDVAENKQLVFTICLDNDWEVEHGLFWVIRGQTPIFVGQDGLCIHEPELSEWNTIHTTEY